MSDFYKILGVSEDSEKIVIDAAFRALAKKYHPDVWTGSKLVAEKKIREINEAYEVLSDSKRRKEYDLKKNVPQPKTQKTESENVRSTGTIKVQKSMLPKNVSLDKGLLIYKNEKITISDITSIEYSVTSTQHSMYFMKTHVGLDGMLILYLDRSGKKIKIGANRSMFGDLRKFENQKIEVDKLNYLAVLLKQGTFKRRVSQCIQNLKGTEVFKYGFYTFFADGTVVKKGVHFENLNSSDIKLTLGYDELNFEKQSIMGFGSKSIKIAKDKDVFLYLLKQYFGISFRGN